MTWLTMFSLARSVCSRLPPPNAYSFFPRDESLSSWSCSLPCARPAARHQSDSVVASLCRLRARQKRRSVSWKFWRRTRHRSSSSRCVVASGHHMNYLDSRWGHDIYAVPVVLRYRPLRNCVKNSTGIWSSRVCGIASLLPSSPCVGLLPSCPPRLSDMLFRSIGTLACLGEGAANRRRCMHRSFRCVSGFHSAVVHGGIAAEQRY